MDRRGFLGAFAAFAGTAAFAPSALAKTVSRPKLDPNLVVLFSDSHVNGHQDKYLQHSRKHLQNVVANILRLDPLPAHAIHFGDLAYLWGHKEDYVLARELLEPLAAAGVKIAIGMGNHDRRSAFLEAFPEYAESTLFPGRIVSEVDAGAVDFIMLDGLAGSDARAPNDSGPVSGSLCAAQEEWHALDLPRRERPFFVCSHWPAWALKAGNSDFRKLLLACPMAAGYIYGHVHRWQRDFIHDGFAAPDILKSLALPSTGLWGDIGFALMRIDGGTATVSLRQHDFFFPNPAATGAVAYKETWKTMIRENKNQTCSFVLPGTAGRRTPQPQ